MFDESSCELTLEVKRSVVQGVDPILNFLQLSSEFRVIYRIWVVVDAL